jgi:pimeloyl-ACP methyl ester carboxylesterase
VPAGWEILEPPSFVASGATVAAYRRWVVECCRARPGPFTLAGHSFGAVLAVRAALADGVEFERLVLVSPSALGLRKGWLGECQSARLPHPGHSVVIVF